MMTASQATDKVEELQEIKEQIEELMSKAREILRGTGMVGRRAEAYWIPTLEGCLDDRSCMVTLQDTIDELNDPGNSEPDEIDSEACPECGCKPGEEYTYGCKACESTESELSG
jgi:hypothetical protein